jgi:hypothetical protein
MVNSLLVFYCLLLFLGFDFLYSAFTRGQERERIARVADPIFDHGLVPNFDGYDVWGEARYRFFTNSLGFKDGAVREVPLKASSRRILLMGDSFTEAIGIPYESTFFGLLNRDGQAREQKVEFLDGGVASYSPSIYYKKVKYLLDRGLQFDEVVLLSDSSDVEDEATSYFCIDDDPKYQKYCTTPPGTYPPASPLKQDFFVDHFAVTNRVRITLKRWIQSLSGNRRRAVERDHERIGWATISISRDIAPRHRGGDRAVAAEYGQAFRPVGEPRLSADHRGLSLGPANRAERSRPPLGQDLAGFLSHPLQGVHRPVSGLLRHRRSRQGLVRTPLHHRRRSLFRRRQPRSLCGTCQAPVALTQIGRASRSRSWRRRTARWLRGKTGRYRI